MILQMAPMWVLAGLSAGWLAHNLSTKGGCGLIPDMILGVSGGIAAGLAALALGSAAGMLSMFGIGIIVATSLIIVQRLCWRPARRYGRDCLGVLTGTDRA